MIPLLLLFCCCPPPQAVCRLWRRGKRRSAAGGGCSEPLSRKGPGWRARTVPASRLGPAVGKLLCPLGTGIFRSAERVPLPAAAKEPKRCLGAEPLRTPWTGWRLLGITRGTDCPVDDSPGGALYGLPLCTRPFRFAKGSCGGLVESSVLSVSHTGSLSSPPQQVLYVGAENRCAPPQQGVTPGAGTAILSAATRR